MPAQLESGAIKHLESEILAAAEEELGDQQIEVSATQHSPESIDGGTESVTIEVTANAPDEIQTELLDYAYEQFVGQEDNIVFQTVQRSHERLQSYGTSNGYSVGGVEASFSGVDVQRSASSITITYGWGSRASSFFERGVSPHTIDGDPLLSFIWADPPEWVRESFDQGRSSGGQFVSGWRVFFPSVDHPGIPAARYVRAGLEWLQSEVSA